MTRWLVYGALAGLLVLAGWLDGYRRGELKLYDYLAEQARAAVPVIVKQGAVTERVVFKYRTRVRVIYQQGETITKEIPVYVPPSADPVLGLGWLRFHDAAAGAVPPPPAGVDVAAPAIAASTALRGIVGNYYACHATAAQLVALQSWIREQYATMNLQPLGY